MIGNLFKRKFTLLNKPSRIIKWNHSTIQRSFSLNKQSRIIKWNHTTIQRSFSSKKSVKDYMNGNMAHDVIFAPLLCLLDPENKSTISDEEMKRIEREANNEVMMFFLMVGVVCLSGLVILDSLIYNYVYDKYVPENEGPFFKYMFYKIFGKYSKNNESHEDDKSETPKKVSTQVNENKTPKQVSSQVNKSETPKQVSSQANENKTPEQVSTQVNKNETPKQVSTQVNKSETSNK